MKLLQIVMLLVVPLIFSGCATRNKFTVADVHQKFIEHGEQVQVAHDGSILRIGDVYITRGEQVVTFNVVVCEIDRSFVFYPRSVLPRVKDSMPALCYLTYDNSKYTMNCTLTGGKKLTVDYVYRYFTQFKNNALMLEDVILRSVFECDAEKCPQKR